MTLVNQNITKRISLLNTCVDIGRYSEFIEKIVYFGRNKISSYICVANVHMVIESWLKPEVNSVINSADIVTPDGMPLVKSLKLLYGIKQDRVAGMDLMPSLLSSASQEGLSIFFYGSTDNVLKKIKARTKFEYPSLHISGALSPPFRPLSKNEDSSIVESINSSGADIVMVALGCPKQEAWMAEHKGKINAVMIGLGGAFPVYAGIQKRAPVWMQKCSLEWLYRLCQEPGRLFKRYLVTNTLFIILIIKEYFRIRVFHKTRRAQS